MTLICTESVRFIGESAYFFFYMLGSSLRCQSVPRLLRNRSFSVGYQLYPTSWRSLSCFKAWDTHFLSLGLERTDSGHDVEFGRETVGGGSAGVFQAVSFIVDANSRFRHEIYTTLWSPISDFWDNGRIIKGGWLSLQIAMRSFFNRSDCCSWGPIYILAWKIFANGCVFEPSTWKISVQVNRSRL